MDPGFLEEGDVGTAQIGEAAILGPAHASNPAELAIYAFAVRYDGSSEFY